MENMDLKFIAKTWAQRAQAEIGAERRFYQLNEQLADLGAHNTVVSLTKKAQQDESRHAVMCAKVAKFYGHPTGFEHFSSQAINTEKAWNNRQSKEEQLLCEVTLMCCITETINASLLNTIYGGMQSSSPTKKVIHHIMKDEVKHSQIGWAHLTHESKKRDCGFMAEYLDEMLDISVKDELFLPVVNLGEYEESFEDGVMPVTLRLDQFIETMKQIVLPGFESFGIDTLKAKKWIQTKALLSGLT